MRNLDTIRAKLRALRAKTVENGCTEEEAMAAAEKMAELLSKHGLSAEELDAEGYERHEVAMGRRSPLDEVWFAVAAFADCRGWYQRHDGKTNFVFFGRPQDALVAEYVYDVLKSACANALAGFRASEVFRRRRTTKTRAHAVKAFQEGLASSLVNKLQHGLWRRCWAGTHDTTKAVILASRAQLDLAMKAEGIELGTARPIGQAKGKFADDAKGSGHAAGRRIEVSASLGASPVKVAGLLS